MTTPPAPAVYLGDCIEVMRTLPDSSVDSIVTDPPYGLGFMGKAWDNLPPGEEWARECLRVLKPGGHLLAFGGSRTWHRLAVAVEDAGFEVRDSIAWLYGSGFPKSLDVSKAIDKAAGAERHSLGVYASRPASTRGMWGAADPDSPEYDGSTFGRGERHITAPATDAAQQWQGWGTALKPAFEPVVVARKPLTGTVAANVLAHGTGALNIDACRVSHDAKSAAWVEKWAGHAGHPEQPGWGTMGQKFGGSPAGRWPANVVLDESQAAALDEQSGNRPGATSNSDSGSDTRDTYGKGWSGAEKRPGYADQGGASRFFYVAKAPTRERPKVDGVAHPTVKPLALMRWLVRLVTPPGGTVLEPFAGSGTTVEACILEGFACIAIEREADYLPLIQARIERAQGIEQPEPAGPSLFDMEETA